MSGVGKICLSKHRIDRRIFRYIPASFLNAWLLGLHYYRLQNYHAALEWLKAESKYDPYHVNSLETQGNIFLALGKYEKCIECYKEALKLGYGNKRSVSVPRLYINLAQALFIVGKKKMAIVRLKEGIYKHNEIFGMKSQTLIPLDSRITLASAYHSLGKLDLAVNTLKEAQEVQKELKNVPDMSVVLLNLQMADILSELNQYDESIEYIEKGLALSYQLFGKYNLSTSLAEIYNYAGEVYERCNQKEKAKSFFKRSLELYQVYLATIPTQVRS